MTPDPKSVQSQEIRPANRIVPYKPIQVRSSSFPDGVSGKPPSRAGIVVAISVIDQIRLRVGVFGGPADGDGRADRAGGPDDFTEGA